MRQGKSSRSAQAVSFGQFRSDLLAGNVRGVVISSDELEYTAYSGTRTSASSLSPARYPSTNNRVQLPQDMGKDWRFIQWISEEHSNVLTDIQFTIDQNLVINLLLPLIPWLLIFGFIYFFVFRALRNQRWQKPMPVVIVNPDSLPKP
jgi:ATP-dependent Zn protease